MIGLYGIGNKKNKFLIQSDSIPAEMAERSHQAAERKNFNLLLTKRAFCFLSFHFYDLEITSLKFSI